MFSRHKKNTGDILRSSVTFEFVKLPSTSFHFILKQERFCTVYLHGLLYSKQFKNTSFFARMYLSLVGSISICPTSKKSTGVRDIHKQDDIKNSKLNA